MSESGKRASNDELAPDEGAVDEVVLEESSGEDDDSVGLELDARQAGEIRQIFLTTLPDYVEPVRQFVQKIVSGEDADGGVTRTLTKTLASMAAAAKRVGIEDVRQTLETLREDVVLLGDSAEGGPLQARIFAALSELDALASSAAGGPRRHSETIVAAFGTISGIDASALEKLVGAGVVFVEQLLRADVSEIAAVSGLDAPTVKTIVAALGARASSGEAADARTDSLLELVERQVENELALDEMRAEVLRMRLRVRGARDELALAERHRDELREALREAKRRVAGKLGVLSQAEAERSELARQLSMLGTELAQRRSRVETLEAERQRAGDEHGRLAQEVAGLSRRVDLFLRVHAPSDTDDSSPSQNGLWREVG